VLRLPVNRGKGGAVRAGVDATPDADIYLLVDADVRGTAAAAGSLLRLVVDGDADLAIGVLPPAGRRGGLGAVRTVARSGIRRASGLDTRAPLSGQRAVRASLLRGLGSVERFGLEVGMTIDAVRAGARVVEVDVDMDHDHTGRRASGFVHRGHQGSDVVRALWPRLTKPAMRVLVIALVTALILGVMLWSGQRWQPTSIPLASTPKKVVVFGMGPITFADIGHGATPTFDSLAAGGALAAVSVRTATRHPTTTGGYLSLGAGSRLQAPVDSGVAYDSSTDVEGGTAGEVIAARTGTAAMGAVAVLGGVGAVRKNQGASYPTKPGALADALATAGLTTAAVGNADQPTLNGLNVISRPVALAAMTGDLVVPAGSVGDDLLLDDPTAPFGVRADPARVLGAFDDALAKADVVFVDPGDLERADKFRTVALPAAVSSARATALRRTDALLAQVQADLPPDTLLFVVSAATPAGAYRLTPMVESGPGVPAGYVVSPSTKRLGIVAITDLAPTILSSLGVTVPDDFPGNAFRFHPGTVDMSRLRAEDRDSDLKERTYYSQAVWFIVWIAVTYTLAMFVVSRRSRVPRLAPILRFLILAGAAFPLATFVVRAIPSVGALGVAGDGVSVAIAVVIAALASRMTRNPLSPLSWIMGATVAALVIDACTGTWLHVSSWLGYSLHSAGRFYGIPNTTFALLAAGAVLVACAHVEYAPRRRDALATAIALFVITVVADGAPSLGDDVGGIVTLVPVFGLVAVALTGRRVRLRTAGLVLLVTGAVLALATTVDLLRPADQRTHLGRFAADLAHDPGNLVTTFLRKEGANFRILQGSIWTWMLPVVVVFVLYLLVWERQWSSLLPPGSPLRIGAIAVPAGALLGFFANDSGPIVLALFFVFFLPYLTLLALDRARGEPELLPATSRVEQAPPDDGAPPVSATSPLHA
jgi:hypothetical protein